MSIKDLTFIIRAQDATTGTIKNIKQKLTGIGTSFSKGLGGMVIRGIKAFAIALGAISIASIKLAADAEQVDDKLSRVYKNMSEKVIKFSDEYANKIGKSRTEIRGMMADLGDLAISMGLNSEKAFEYSQRITKLAQDLAAAKNIKVEDAMDAISKATRGNIRELKQLGYNLDENKIKQKALELGYKRTTKSITAEAKAFATLNIIESKTIDLQDEAQKSLNTFSGKTSKLKAVTNNLSTEFGTQIIKGLRLGEAFDYVSERFVNLTKTLSETKAVENALSGISNTFLELRKELLILQKGVGNLLLNLQWAKTVKQQKEYQSADISRLKYLNGLKKVQDSIDAASKALEQYREISKGAPGINVSPSPIGIQNAIKSPEGFQTYDMAEYLRQISENTSLLNDIVKGPPQG